MEGLLYLSRPHRVLFSFGPHTRSNPEWNRYSMRKGIKFWIERLIINSAEELGFSGTWFHIHPSTHPSLYPSSIQY